MYYWIGLINDLSTRKIVRIFKMHSMLKTDMESIWGSNSQMIQKMQTSSTTLPLNESKDGINRNNPLIKVSTQANLSILILNNHL
jgi:hypothetical protein